MSLDILSAVTNLAVVSASPGGVNVSEIIAQVVTTLLGFAIVYWILKKYAFGPVLSILDERTDRVESDLKKAEALRQEAAKERDELEARLSHIEEEGRAKMVEVINEGKRISAKIQEDAQAKANEMLEKAQSNIQYEMEKSRAELKEEIIKMTLMATEKMIHERLDDDKHRQLVNNFLDQLERN